MKREPVHLNLASARVLVGLLDRAPVAALMTRSEKAAAVDLAAAVAAGEQRSAGRTRDRCGCAIMALGKWRADPQCDRCSGSGLTGRSLHRLRAHHGRSQRAHETRTIWEACWARSGGVCECGCGGGLTRNAGFHSRATLDHFWGRAKRLQSVENCWLIRRDCEREKTWERPDKETWLRRFRTHVEHHGYSEQVAECDKYLEGKVMMANLWKQRATSEP